jgi:hypothetical protein
MFVTLQKKKFVQIRIDTSSILNSDGMVYLLAVARDLYI